MSGRTTFKLFEDGDGRGKRCMIASDDLRDIREFLEVKVPDQALSPDGGDRDGR